MFRAALLSLAFLAAPAAAQYFRAEPVSPPTEQRFVARDSAWQCAEGVCVAERSRSRPAHVCASVARELGPLRRFAAEGQEFDAEQLDACNRRAR